jgi:hypothetical protein
MNKKKHEMNGMWLKRKKEVKEQITRILTDKIIEVFSFIACCNCSK